MSELERYALAITADPDYYDDPARTDDEPFEVAGMKLPAGWSRGRHGLWVSFAPPGELPAQGWKIHVSARWHEAEKTIRDVLAYCVAHAVAVKFLRSEFAVRLTNGKYAPRSSSGKVLTLYPADDSALEEVLRDLGELLAGREGPYVLSDLRVGSGPVFVRFGGFADRTMLDRDGRRVPAIEAPDGRLVPDVRQPVFTPPNWAAVPAFLEPLIERFERDAAKPLPFEITGVLHFSNGGGVYRGKLVKGPEVVLKEARPHAGVDHLGQDAVIRLHREREVLIRLRDKGFVPALHEHLVVGEHYFLALEHVEGATLYQELSLRNPLLRPQADKAQRTAYLAWLVPILEELSRILDELHDRGIAFGDVHPQNVILRPDGRLCLIDFEAATDLGCESGSPMAAPGFRPPPGMKPGAADWYSFGCLALFAFLPLTSIMELDRTRSVPLLAAVGEEFPAAKGLVARVGKTLSLDGSETSPVVPERWGSRTARSIVDAVLDSASPERDDRLYPGDAMQLPGDGLGLAHGAAGVLYALSAASYDVPAEHVSWLERRALANHAGAPGLLHGQIGIALAAAHLGKVDTAREILARNRTAESELVAAHYAGGLAGLVLAKVELGELLGDRLLEQALVHGHDLRGLVTGKPARVAPPDAPGLSRGYAGISLALCRLYDLTHDRLWLDAAQEALLRDLARCTADDTGAWYVDDGRRLLPYLADGGAGVALAADAILRHREDPALAVSRDALRRGCAVPAWSAHVGLFGGRAGLVAYSRRVEELPTLLRHAIVTGNGGIAFAGDQLLRLSMDLATGAAGVLLGASAAQTGGPVLPGLGWCAGQADRSPV
ncbi:class III lanthionine synthetase LanKC [Amycolatopsis samaneae]|uniref:non-specific serine/threonine protein kinase n=1 Tax=Amycolatopsis samaneae TaxID=664691 RepID=A0ABW5GB45_9PSEU